MKKKILFLTVSPLLIQGCSTLGNFDLSEIKNTLSDLTSQVTMLFTDNIIAIEPPSRNILLKYNNVILKSNIGVRNRVVRALGDKLSYSKIGNDKYFDSVSYYSGNENTNSETVTFDLIINEPNINRENFREKRFKCPGDKLVKSCDSSEAYHYSVSCYRMVASMDGSYSVYDYRKRIIEKEAFNFKSEDKSCEDYTSSKKNSSQLKELVEIKSGVEIAQLYVPLEVERPNDLIEKDGNLPESAQQEMASIFELATDEGVLAAKNRYEILYNKFPRELSIKYNIAYCNMLLGNYKVASNQFREYLSLVMKPNEDAEKYLKESDEWVEKGFDKVNKS